MATINTNLTCNLQHAVKAVYLDGVVFSQDNMANQINVSVYNGSTPVSLVGTVSANIIRSDGVTVAATNGTTNGNIATIVLPEAAYYVPGVISIIVKLTSNGSVTTLAVVIGNVYQSTTATIADPGTIIPSITDLIVAIDEAVATIPVDYSAVCASLSYAAYMPLYEDNGYISSSDGSLNRAGDTYMFTSMTRVVPGDQYEYKAYGSSSVLVIAAYSNLTDSTAIINKSVVGLVGQYTEGLYIVPDGVHYIRMTSLIAADEKPMFRRSVMKFQGKPLGQNTDINSLTEPAVYNCLNGSFTPESAPPAFSNVGTLIVTKETDFNISYQTFIESYSGNVYTRIKRATGWDNWSDSAEKRKISILFVGNSLTQDGIAYLPYVLKTYYPEIDFKFYMWYCGGYDLSDQYSAFTNNDAADIFSLCENNTYWTNYNSSKTMADVLTTYKFDIVCMQEYFNYKSEYTTADLADWNNCRDYIQNHYTGGNGLEFVSLFHAPKRDDATNIFNTTKTGNGLILQDTIAEDMIPVGIAVYRALSTDLDNLGDEGHLSPDGTHAQEGLPCLLQTYTAACWVFDKLAINKSVYGLPFKMTTAIYNTINVPGANLGTGVIEGTDAQNLLAQEVAIKAYKEGKQFVLYNIFPDT